ncbi:hypothetical protein [Demequina soli]|uniref:hypothetical protein n=1 Tax=Demequina soli TaxID=1638987 RepID=UPI00078465DB|nr:hypothetical protein [Demequina soli]
MANGEDVRRGADLGSRAGSLSASTGTATSPPRTRLPFYPVTEPTPHDVVDTDEIPVVGGAAVAEPRKGRSSRAAGVDETHRFGEDDDADPMVAPDGAEAADDEPFAAHPPRPVGLIIVVAMMTVTLLAAAALIAYLWRVSDAWEVRVAELTEVGHSLGTDLTAERDTLAATQQQLDLVTQQLSASKDTVSRLQAENAQWGDDAAYAQEQIDGLQSIITSASSVASSLSRCVEGHEKLVDYLRSPDDFDKKEIRAYEKSVDELCAAATAANVSFQQSVAG